MHNVVHHLQSSDILSDCAVRAESLHNWARHPVPASKGFLARLAYHIDASCPSRYITIGQIISIAFSLPVTAMSTLEHIKIEPVGIIEPGCRHGSTKWVESHQMILIDGTNCTCQGFPNFCFHIASRISSDYPHYIRIVLISFGKEGSVCFRFFYIHLPTSYQSSPDTYHTYIYTFTFSCTDDIIHMVPITIYSFLSIWLKSNPSVMEYCP